MNFDWQLSALLLTGSFLAAVVMLFVFGSVAQLRGGRGPAQTAPPDDGMVFLFDDDRLIDATPTARAWLATGPEKQSDLDRLSSLLAPQFPDFRPALAALVETGSTQLQRHETLINAELRGGITRVAVSAHDDGPQVDQDASSAIATASELGGLRDVVQHMPVLCWREDAQNQVIWANAAYLQLAEATLADGENLPWPLPRIFKSSHDNTAEPAPYRASTKATDGTQHWYDCVVLGQGDTRLYYASPADAVVRAESNLRDFVQTLTKIFADLPTGLAVFSRSRELVLFNPALIELFQLDTPFLISRPSLAAFLDRLRENRMMPEPKNYLNWRQKILTLEEQAASGAYQETWNLPTGQTYRISGCPHPDGAVALIFEDISAEVSLTRRFRAELELNQAVIDAVDEAIAVFADDGTLRISNGAFTRLWGLDPSTMIEPFTVRQAMKLWSDTCAPTGVWADLGGFVNQQSERQAWHDTVTTKGGDILQCRVVPIGRQATLVGFTNRRARVTTSEAPARQAMEIALPR